MQFPDNEVDINVFIVLTNVQRTIHAMPIQYHGIKNFGENYELYNMLSVNVKYHMLV